MKSVNLSYPPSKLSPNARVHYMQRARLTKDYRWQCAMKARAQGLGKIDANRLNVRIIFYPPDKRRRDKDNLITAFKAGADGIADVTGVDDADWTVTHALGEPIPGGGVLVSIEPEAA